MGVGDGPGIAALVAGVQVLTARQQAIAANVANVDTPGYRALDVNFPASFARALAGRATPVLQYAPGVMRVDGNGVDIDKEMVQVAKTSQRYAAVSQDLQMQFKLLRTAVTEGA